MSLPIFPENNLDRDDSIDMILASIAMEEVALSHIINAEGEKLQYILGDQISPKPTVCEILEINRSIRNVLRTVADNQFLLKSKLSLITDILPIPEPPCPPVPPYPPCPPCPPCPPFPPHSDSECAMSYSSPSTYTISNECPLVWQKKCGSCKLKCNTDCCDESECTNDDRVTVWLMPSTCYSINFTANIQRLNGGIVSTKIRSSKECKICMSKCGCCLPTCVLCANRSNRCANNLTVVQQCNITQNTASLMKGDSLTLKIALKLCDKIIKVFTFHKSDFFVHPGVQTASFSGVTFTTPRTANTCCVELIITLVSPEEVILHYSALNVQQISHDKYPKEKE